MYPQLIQSFLEQEHLPTAYGEDAQQWFLPFIEELRAAIHEQEQSPFLLGINGAQGTGKSTLAKLIVESLNGSGLHALSLSIDDFYLGKEERLKLAARKHPLLATRGVPGTHDTTLLGVTLEQLKCLDGASAVAIPRFDKASDDRVPEAQFTFQEDQLDLVILEGWFVGSTAEAEQSLESPLNALEENEDPQGEWRRFVNSSLHSDYQPLFQSLHQLVMLRAPSFEQVYEWRGLQEEKLAQKSGPSATGIMNSEQLHRFIQHYERLTRHCLKTLPQQADVVFELNSEHRVTSRTNRE